MKLTFETIQGTFTSPPGLFDDAMSVRLPVFVDEQKVPAENERDAEDETAPHWVIYDVAAVPRKPVGTIRVVVPAQPTPKSPEEKVERKRYIKLGRLAILKDYRRIGLGSRLVEEAVEWMKVRENRDSVVPVVDGEGWDGRILVHAQVAAQKAWERYGFVVDESMGVWDEEGIDHVGMWRTVQLEE
ncbi:acyl-CoA N-acyltransferase [Ascobolus immersus RN42]|uniref:Acyl-CoA N-acyltransferase n=1 Tax=Ascobolus immersus RN42 TaxID=1160509 RepID=A0A3N4IBB8_ASCIM|nr:acyl-CoA N-acyltransferase [Ascobolus immersus RN42]